MSSMASQITRVSIVCSTVCSGADQRKHRSSASLFPAQTAQNVSIYWRHHETILIPGIIFNINNICHFITHDQVEAQHQMWNMEGLPDLADLPDLAIPDVDSCTGNDTVLYTIYWRNCTVAMLSDVFINLEILNTPLILVIMLLQDNNIFKKLTSGIMDSLTGFQDNLVQSWWPDFPTGVAGHVGGHFSLSKQD